MKIVLKHEGTWLMIKEVYAIRRRQRRGKRQQRGPAPYGTVAVSIDSPPVDGMKNWAEVEVPATKVMRFIVKMFEAPGNAVVVVEPATPETYVARIYARSEREAIEAAKLAEAIIARLRSRTAAEPGEEEESEEEEQEEGEEE